MASAKTKLNVLEKRALFVGLWLACTVGGPMPAIAGESIVLGPPRAFNEAGTPHTVVASVTDASGQPVAGRGVDFAILYGPHAGRAGTGITDQGGHAIFTYVGTAIGTDTLFASFVDADGASHASNLVTKEWVLPRCGNGVLDPGEVCEPETLCAGVCNPITRVCFDIGCRSDCTCPCGDGILDPGEECDDGNRTREDGCSPGCTIERCPLGAGFWKNHPDAWQAGTLVLGRETYSKSELLAILETPIGPGNDADASLILADQMIAAELSIAAGSVFAAEIVPILSFPDPLLEFPGRLPYQVDPRSSIGEELIRAARELEKYNKGKFTPDCQAGP